MCPFDEPTKIAPKNIPAEFLVECVNETSIQLIVCIREENRYSSTFSRTIHSVRGRLQRSMQSLIYWLQTVIHTIPTVVPIGACFIAAIIETDWNRLIIILILCRGCVPRRKFQSATLQRKFWLWCHLWFPIQNMLRLHHTYDWF